MSRPFFKNHMFKNHGVGVGLRAPHFATFLNPATRPHSVNWVEVISENFMEGRTLPNTRSILTLEKIRADFPIALHGVSLSVGSADLDPEYLKKWKALVDRVDPIVVSDHLCWTRTLEHQSHDLNPLIYTEQEADRLAEKIARIQDFLKRRILIENVSTYLTFDASEMGEAEFVARIVERADCGLLLDVNNVYVNSVNHGFDAREYLEKIPHARVGQIHLAGHSDRSGFLIDTHDHSISESVWSLFRWYGERFGHASSMIERDGNIPEWSELEKEVLTLRSLFRPGETVHWPGDVPSDRTFETQNPPRDEDRSHHQWMNSLLGEFEVEGICDEPPFGARERFEVYEDAYWTRLNGAITDDFKRFHHEVSTKQGSEAWDTLVFDALLASPPSSWSIIELGEAFLDGLEKIGYFKKEPASAQLAREDWAIVKAELSADVASNANRDFTALAGFSPAELERVVLAVHPSIQVLSEQKHLMWWSGDARTGRVREKSFSSDDWRSILSVLNEAPMLALMASDPRAESLVQEGIQTGLICGWKTVDGK